jgi:hypothetical protein
MLQAHQLHALQQTFWPTYQWPPPTWTFASTNSSSVTYFTNGTTLIWTKQFLLQPTNDTSITPPASGLSAVYSNSPCVLSFQQSTNGIDWYQAQGTGYVYMVVVNTNSPMFVQMTNAGFSGSNTLGTWRIRPRSPSTSPSTGQTLLSPSTGGYLISGFVNAQWEGWGTGITYRPASGPVYLELGGTPGTSPTPALKVSISQPSAGAVQLSWPSATNYQYQAQKLPALGGINWSNLGTAQRGTGSTLNQSDSTTGSSYKFYRVVYTNAP